jgi:ribonuclease HII
MPASPAKGPGPTGIRAFSLAHPGEFLRSSLLDQKRLLLELTPAEREPWLALLEADPRKGRRRLASSLRHREAKERRLLARWHELSSFDESAAGTLRLAGVDEVGRGPLAGPVTAAALILPRGYEAPGLDDSKRLSRRARESWAERLRRDALAFGLADVPAEEIDRRGIRRAVAAAMSRALAALDPEPELVLVDGLPELPESPSLRAVVGGDAKSLAIAAASVLAKVHRDALMREAHARWPEYGFDRNMGYGSEEHCRVLLDRGPCPIHRRSFCGRWLPSSQQDPARPPR